VVAHQELELGVAESLPQLMDRAAALVDRAGMKASIERPADGVHITGARSFEDALAAPLVDVRFELSPARKAIVAREAARGWGERAARVT